MTIQVGIYTVKVSGPTAVSAAEAKAMFRQWYAGKNRGIKKVGTEYTTSSGRFFE